MEKNTFKKVLVLVFAVLMCAISVICVSASPESYATGRTYTYSDTEYTAQRPSGATVTTHVYYVGGANGSDTNDGSTKETPFASISGAVTYAQSQGYLLEVDYTATELHEVKLVLVGDTVETPAYKQISNNNGANGCLLIQGGILTIVPDDGVDATITIGTPTTTVQKNFFYLRPKTKDSGKYVELNLGAPGMNGTITFDGTYYNMQTNNGSPDWGGFLRIGDESYTDVAIANMYDGVTIANIGYNEETGTITYSAKTHVVQVDCGTFNMYGGTITQNVCYSVIASYGRSGLGAYIYGGEITNNNGRVLYTNWDANAKIVVYDCLIQNNVGATAWGAIEASKEKSTIILYGGTLLNNIGAGKDGSTAVNAQIYSSGYVYISDKVIFENGDCVSLDGTVYTISRTYYVKNSTYTPMDMKSTVIYAKDGSAMGYGYVSSKQTAGYYLKDRNIETTETLTLEKVAGYQLYTKPGTTSCAYAIPDDDPIYTGITPSADMTSAVSYYNSEKTHVESYEIVTPAGADTDGLGRYTCQDCGATRDVVIEAVGHVHNYVTTVTPPTCTERGYTTHTCDVEGCTDSYVTDYVDALGHDYSGEGTVVTPPKCLEQGYTTYTCQREGCGYSYVGDYVTILGHDYVENVIVEPTASSAGLNRYTCSRCDDFSQDRVAYLAPTEVDVKVTVDVDGVRTELTVKLTDIYNCNYTAPSALTDYALALTGIKTFTVDGTSYTKANVVEISVPLGVLTVNNSGSLFNNNKVIEKVDFSASDGVTVNSNAFQNATSLKDIVFGDNMTISEKAFNTCTALTKIVVGDGLTINFNGQYIFNACSNIESVEFGASDITFGANSFRTTSSTSEYTPITSIKFSDGGNYTFGAKAFGRTSITELIIPDGATAAFSSTSVNNTDPFWSSDFLIYAYVGEGTLNVGKMFDDCMGLEEVVLVGPETIGTYGFCDYTGRSDKTLKVYIHKSDVTFGDNAFYKRSGIQVYTMAPITKANVFNSCSSYTIYYGTAHEYTPHTFAPTCTEYGYDGYITSCPHCGENIEPEYSTIYQVFENALTSGTASSETILDKTNFVNPAGHSAGEVIRIVYENGFDNVGSYKRVCTVCGENYDAEYADAIFKALGYSPKNDNTSIYAGFIVNIDALNAYNSYLEVGKELKYGILVSNVTGKDALTVADGSVDTNSVMAEIKDHTLNRIGISINGLADHVDLEIVISAYVIDENGDISFIQKNGAKNGSYYTSGVTVNGAENALGAMTLNQIITLGQVGYEDACATSGHTVVVDPAVAPTCTTTGLTEGKHCSACYAVIVAQKTVAATGHTPGPEATCTTAQTCTVCGAVLTDATGHTEVIDPEAEPTCTATGLTEGKHCSVCNIIIVAQNTVPALGHTEVTIPGTAATCVATGLSDGKKCTVCNAITEAQTSLPALGHTYGEWVVTKEATQTETGTKEHTCSVCSYTESVIINVVYDGSLGSAGRLSDKTIIVSIFANDSGTSWSNSDADNETKSTMLDRLGIAVEWINQQCRTYGVTSEFVYDWEANSDLYYTADFSSTDMVNMTGDGYYTQRTYILNSIDTDALKEKYGAQNVIYMLYFNTGTENTDVRSWTLSRKSSTSSIDVEVINVFVRRYNGFYTNVFSASSCAHEILHCFGAYDYYYSSTTITQEFVDECNTTTSEYHQDIMLTVNDGDSMSGLTFSALDAYYVGLIDSSEDERVSDVITEYGLGKSVHETIS